MAQHFPGKHEILSSISGLKKKKEKKTNKLIVSLYFKFVKCYQQSNLDKVRGIFQYTIILLHVVP